ncbi:hypothetical protein [Halomontanus rarus]|uniref:hypothetical protein n=1 Tax=Halomontanus rarus TaxID=3034020 RepID=UPI00293BA1DF|nr:hypothetical protein [Halovivax sp. KZCA124]
MRDRSTDNGTERSLRDVLGCVHVGGLYDFTDRNYLNEGAATLEELGTDVIRIWDSNNQSQTSYRFDMDWPDAFESVTEVLRDDHVRELFDRPFSTYVLTSYARSTPGIQDHYWRDGVTDEQYEHTVTEYRRATEHLLETYDGTGNVFVFQNWEGDWAILDTIEPDPPEPTTDAIDGMTRWLSARQEGIEQGRANVDSDVRVLHAVSVNRVRSAMQGDRRVVNAVVPSVDPSLDMVAYSSWDVLVDVRELEDRAAVTAITDSLDFIHEHAPEPSPYVESVLGPGEKNVYVGEFGWDLREDEEYGMRAIRLLTETSIEWGARWLLFWQLYSNEPAGEYEDRPENDDVKGFYLVKPDGDRSRAWDYFSSVLEGE